MAQPRRKRRRISRGIQLRGAGDVRGYGSYAGIKIPPVAIGLGLLMLLILAARKPLAEAGGYVVKTVTDWIAAQQWLPLDAPIRSHPGSRLASIYTAVAKQFNVANAARYQPPPGSTATWCNIYVWDVTRAMGVEIPHFWSGADNGKEMRANDIHRWLDMGTNGWRKVTAAAARTFAAQGIPVVLAWPNPGGTGHVAMMLPDGLIAQAGRTNFFGGSVGAGFGVHVPDYFAAPG